VVKRDIPQSIHHGEHDIVEIAEVEMSKILGGRNITWHGAKITKNDRWVKNSQKSALVWITALSASGKSTIAT